MKYLPLVATSKGIHRILDVSAQASIPKEPCIARCGVETREARMGEVTALNRDGEAIVATLKLNNEAEKEERRKWLDVLRAVAVADECRFRKLVGFRQTCPIWQTRSVLSATPARKASHKAPAISGR